MLGAADGMAWCLAAATVAAVFYQAAAARLVHRFCARKAEPAASQPPVTLLKPLCGEEPGLEAALRSFCCQDYPTLQVVFGVHSHDDPAHAIALGIKAEFADLDIAVVVGGGRPADGNPKLANLIDMMPVAKHGILVLSDSDITVGPDYLPAVVGALSAPGVGIATCLYTGRGDDGVWSRLASMGINHGFLPSVLVGMALGRVDGCFGATIAIRRETLAAIGGFEAFRAQLADDYLLGAAVRASGQAVALAPVLPSSATFEPDLKTLLAHEIRWGRTVALIDRAGYASSIVTLAIPMGLAAWAAGAGVFWAILALLGRWWAVREQEDALALAPQPLALVVARDLVSLAVQVTALCGRSVLWRGRRFRIRRDGTLAAQDEKV